jgi:hypothetical protein
MDYFIYDGCCTMLVVIVVFIFKQAQMPLILAAKNAK